LLFSAIVFRHSSEFAFVAQCAPSALGIFCADIEIQITNRVCLRTAEKRNRVAASAKMGCEKLQR
jgi:hypothetical protein